MRVVVASDHPLILEGISAVLAEKTTASVVARVWNWRSLISAAEENHPDLVIIDVERTRLGWVRAVEELRKALPQLAMACISLNGDLDFLEEMRAAGALTKTIANPDTDELLEFLRQLTDGGHMQVHSALLPRHLAAQSLTTREREILRLVARGSHSNEIASELNLSVRTVEFHRANILRKTGLRSAADLTRFAIGSGVLPVPGSQSKPS